MQPWSSLLMSASRAIQMLLLSLSLDEAVTQNNMLQQAARTAQINNMLDVPTAADAVACCFLYWNSLIKCRPDVWLLLRNVAAVFLSLSRAGRFYGHHTGRCFCLSGQTLLISLGNGRSEMELLVRTDINTQRELVLEQSELTILCECFLLADKSLLEAV